MLKWLGHATQTTASVVVRGESDGDAILICNGVTYTEAVLTAVKDSLVRFDITGLKAGTHYDYTVTIPTAETATGQIKTQSDGIARVGFSSCGYVGYDCLFATGLYELDAYCSIGDEDYYEGTTNVDLPTATNPDSFNAATASARRQSSYNYLLNKVPSYIVHDDHEISVNDARWLLSKFTLAMPFVDTEAKMQDVIAASAEGTFNYSIGNAENTDAGIDTKSFYHRFDLGNHAEVFVLSSVIWGSDPTDPQRLIRPDFSIGDVSMLGVKQLAWLKAKLKSSTKTFKIIMSPKMTLTAEFKNPDGYSAVGYWEEFNSDLAPYIHVGTDWVVPGGVIWCTGDYHSPSVHASFAGVDGATYDHVEVCACPSQKDNSGVRDSGAGGTHTVQWVNTGQGNGGTSTDLKSHWLRNFGVVEVAADGSYLEAKIVLGNGSEWWKGRVLAGENKLSYPARTVSVS